MKNKCSIFVLSIASVAQAAVPSTMAIEHLKIAQANLEDEMSKMEGRCQNIELALESTRKEVLERLHAYKETQSANSVNSTRLKTVEKNIEKLASDLKQIKTHTNELQASLIKKIEQCDKLLALQAEEIEQISKSMQLMMTALQKKRSHTYRVQSGDTLEKIAKEQGTTLEKLKDENNLVHNTIRIGQELKIPN